MNTPLRDNALLKDRYSGERCFILACGPSIANQELSILAGEKCISVSNFFVHPDFKTIRPIVHCIAGFHHPLREDSWQGWLSEIALKTGDATLFFSLSDFERNLKRGYFSRRNFHFLDISGAWDQNTSWEIDLTQRLPSPQSVSIMAIFVAIYLGFKQINLLGCDHDWILNFGKSRHFYDEEQHHCVRDGYNEWDGSTLVDEVRSNMTLWRQYELLNSWCRERGIVISNLTAFGLLDVFPRKSLSSAFLSAVPIQENGDEGSQHLDQITAETLRKFINIIDYLHQEKYFAETFWVAGRALALFPESGPLNRLHGRLLSHFQLPVAERSAIIQDINLLKEQGSLSAQRRQYADAALYFKRAIELGAADPDMILRYANALQNIGYAAEAKKIVSERYFSCLPPIPAMQVPEGLPPGFWGDFPTWKDAQNASAGYDSDNILETTKRAALQVKYELKQYERDSVVFDYIEYPWLWNVLEHLLQIGGRNGGKLSVLDFGGSLGSSFYATRSFLYSTIHTLKWSVVEQYKTSICGQSFFQSYDLQFFDSIKESQLSQKSDVLFASSVLQYIEKPYDLIKYFCELNFPYLLIDRTPFGTGDRDFLTVQSVPQTIYSASYPAWFFNREKFLEAFKPRYRVIAEFPALDTANVPSTYLGFLLRRI